MYVHKRNGHLSEENDPLNTLRWRKKEKELEEHMSESIAVTERMLEINSVMIINEHLARIGVIQIMS